MARNPHKDPSIDQGNRKQDFNTKMGRGRRAKTQSNKKDRQNLIQDLKNRLKDLPH